MSRCDIYKCSIDYFSLKTHQEPLSLQHLVDNGNCGEQSIVFQQQSMTAHPGTPLTTERRNIYNK